MEEKERRFPADYVGEAIETADHLLWEAIIVICGSAVSKAFQKKGSEVRVVYEIKEVTVDMPCKNFHDIKRVFTELSVEDAPIQKTKKSGIVAMQKWCSRPDYFQFFLQILEQKIDKLTQKTGIVKDDVSGLLEWDLVEVAFPGREELRCPCSGLHLDWTRGLFLHFKVVLFRPKRVGQNMYEFRFSVASA